MAYFSKEVYDRKREYAYRTSREGLTAVATILAINDMGIDKKYPELTLDAWEEYLDSLDADEYNEKDDELNDLISDYEIELEPLKELSHARHEIHSTSREHFLVDDNPVHRLLTDVGTQYSDGGMVYEVNKLNKKLKLVDKDIPEMYIPDVSMDDSIEEVLEYYDIEVSDDYDENVENAREALMNDYSEIVNDWSNSVRDWFGELNERFGSDFPD